MANGSATLPSHLLSFALLASLLVLLSRLLWREIIAVLTGYTRRGEGEDVGQG